jgi:hypothetical protein
VSIFLEYVRSFQGEKYDNMLSDNVLLADNVLSDSLMSSANNMLSIDNMLLW